LNIAEKIILVFGGFAFSGGGGKVNIYPIKQSQFA